MRTIEEWLRILHGQDRMTHISQRDKEVMEQFDAAILRALPQSRENLLTKGTLEAPMEMLTPMKLMADVFLRVGNSNYFFSAVCDVCVLIEAAQGQGWPDSEIESILFSDSDGSVVQ